MVGLFNQKRELGLIMSDDTPPRELISFSEKDPILLLILANHDPDSTILRTLLKKLRPPKRAELRFATSNFLGYGLFDQGMLALKQFQALSGKRV